MQDDRDRPHRVSNTENAEGVRKTNENTGGISNRELSEEIDRQGKLPARGTSRDERQVEPGNEEGDVER